MDYSLDVPVKVEKMDERDNNDDLRLLYDGKIKNEEVTNEIDWCVSNFGSDGLLEPLFFKPFVEAQEPQSGLCSGYFPDRNISMQHNLSHLQVTIDPSIFRCSLCTSLFTSKHSMERHITSHNHSKTKNLSYKPKGYRPKKDVKIKTKHSIKYEGLKDGLTNLLPYKPKAFKSVDDNSNKTHECNICHKTYSYKNWHAHVKDVHGSGKFSCRICGAVFKCERYLKKHLSKVHVDKVSKEVKCDLCGNVLQSLYALTTHKRNVHSDNKHVCYICKSTLKCKSYLLSHMRRLHYSDGKKHECECGKSFRSRRYLMEHKRNSHSKKNKEAKIKTEEE